MDPIPEGAPDPEGGATAHVPEPSRPWHGRKPSWIRKASTNVIERLRKVALKPAEEEFIGYLKETRTPDFQNYLNAREATLRAQGGVPLTLMTSSGIPLKVMHFSASRTGAAQAPGSPLKSGSVVEDGRIGATGPTVVLCAGSDTSSFSENYQHSIDAYLNRGINVVIFDYPGVGLSGGDFSVKGSYEGAEVVYQYLTEEKHVDPHNILVDGYSMGSGPATHLSSKHPGVNLLLRFPFARMSEIGVEEMADELSSKKKKVFRAVAGPLLERVARFALPYDNEAAMRGVHGNVGVAISGAHDMHDEELQTKQRLLNATPNPLRSVGYEVAGAMHDTHYAPSQDPTTSTVASRNMSSMLDDFLVKIRFTTLRERPAR